MSHWFFVVAIVLAVGAPARALAQDAHVGTWKQNFTKSKQVPPPAGPQPQSVMRTYEVFGDGLKATILIVSADGTRTTASYSAHFDSKDYPYIGNPTIDTIALTRIDNHSFKSVNKKAGQIIASGTNVVSRDGKTMTYTSKGANAQGQAITSSVQVFEKQ